MQTPRKTNRNTWIPDDHLERIVAQLGADDRKICLLAILTGYRIDDLLRLRWDAITGGTLTVKESKTGKTRTHALTSETIAILHSLRSEGREGAEGHRTGLYIFPTRRGRIGDKPTLSRCTVWRAFRRAVRDARLDGNGYTVHSLRKCYAWHLYRDTRSLSAVQHDLNHDRPDTTFLYLQEPFEKAARNFDP